MIGVTKGLVIDEPWIGLILAGQKTWEMRSTSTSHRGWFGLIRKGSGAVVGIARLIDGGQPLSPEAMIASFEKHRIPEAMIRSGEVAKWNTPWILENVRRLPQPVPYRHRPGAVTWVQFDPEVTRAIEAGINGTAASRFENEAAEPPIAASFPFSTPVGSPASKMPPTTQVQPFPPPRTAGTPPSSGMWGEVSITEGNIKNNHFYLRSLIHCFPADLIGGANRSKAASRTAVIEWGGPSAVETDIDGEKQFFRARGWIGRFFGDNNAEPGDRVRIVETAPYRYRVSLRKKGTL